MEYYLTRTYLNYLPHPINNDVITSVCLSKSHRLIKVCRLYSLLEAEDLIKRDDIRIIFLVRDPRGMAASRMRFTNITTPNEHFNQVIYGEFKLHPKMEEVVSDYCHWLKVNYFTPLEHPVWLKHKYMMIRYEDLERKRKETVTKIYNFIGLKMRFDVLNSIFGDGEQFEQYDLTDNSEQWRHKLKMEEVVRIQEVCSSDIFKMFSYISVANEKQLLDNTTSLVGDLLYNVDSV
ncbi:carbohydrate sulfotransferase 1-like [Saccoglossus kowalevskii]|uniref:Carbohydrate sulfotransferase 1-like n=1 Tax=Saccoglossus kowalevskii TaxID=10224 RepID=A0ABM0LY81_SACKO|nr:PREDICTED: carbohydrate sulfotransferase 1-like [Saccoglossus kowalevskii]